MQICTMMWVKWGEGCDVDILDMKMYATISIFISALTCCPTCSDFFSYYETSS